MHRYALFPSLRGCALRRSLERLVAECRGRHGSHRPEVGPLKIVVVDGTIEKLPDIHAYHHLEGPWLKWHKAATGEDLADPKSSFATTAQRCVARIERRRAHA
jgi:hypothetical protein